MISVHCFTAKALCNNFKIFDLEVDTPENELPAELLEYLLPLEHVRVATRIDTLDAEKRAGYRLSMFALQP